MNIKSASERLKIALSVIVDTANRNTAIEFVDEEALHRIVVREGAKGYHHKSVDEDNEDGFFLAYKRLCKKIGELISETKPGFPYPLAVASTLVETANNNLYFAKHLPRLTDLDGKGQNLSDQVKQLLEFITFGLIHTSMIEDSRFKDSA